MAKLYEHSATELAALIASGDVSSREVVQAHLNRIDEVNTSVNAITVVLRESALAAADLADRLDNTHVRGPLHGVPFTIKESIDCMGSATTYGVQALENSMPHMDAPVVARMKAAGAIPIGRTNLPEFGLRLCTDNPLRGATLNPWNAYLTPGGSSGGDAVALATGMTPFGLGNDSGGSLRSPAYCCGIAALKPTTGRIARASSIGPMDFGMASQAMLVDGPMARTIADLQLGLSVLAGRDIRDPRSVDVPLKGSDTYVRRAALVTHIPGVELSAVTLNEIQRAGNILSSEGWEVDEAQPPELEEVNEVWGRVLSIDYFHMIRTIQPYITRDLFHNMMDMCRMFDARDLPNSEIHADRSRLTRLWSAFFERYPVMIGPNWTQLPWPVDADLAPGTGLKLLLDTTPFVTPANVLGLPALALPTGIKDGLPTGIQIYADLWREDLCLQVADIIERDVDTPTPIDPVG